MAKYEKTIKEVATEKIQKDFLTMEEQEVCGCGLTSIQGSVICYTHV